MFRRQVLADALPLIAVKQFAFDLELLVVARLLGYTRVVEAPIQLSYRFSSTISPGAVYRILWDTAAIFYRLHVTHYYARRRREELQQKAAAAAPSPIRMDSAAVEPAGPTDALHGR